MAGFAVHSIDRKTGRRTVLNRLGTLSDVEYSYAFPGSCLDASWSLAVPTNMGHFAFRAGSMIEIYWGPLLVWSGRLTDPQRGLRGQPWKFGAVGWAASAATLLAISTGTTPSTALSTVVPNAITRGLMWIAPTSYPAYTMTQNAPGTVGALLDQVAALSGQKWRVGANRILEFVSTTTTPEFIVLPRRGVGARQIAAAGTDVFVRYLDSATNTIKYAVSSNTSDLAQAIEKHELLLDLTDLGPINPASFNLTTLATNVLADVQPKANYGGSFTLGPNDATPLTNTMARYPNEMIRPNQMFWGRGMMPDAVSGDLFPWFSTPIVIGETRYRAEDGSVSISPLGTDDPDFGGALEKAHATAGGIFGNPGSTGAAA